MTDRFDGSKSMVSRGNFPLSKMNERRSAASTGYEIEKSPEERIEEIKALLGTLPDLCEARGQLRVSRVWSFRFGETHRGSDLGARLLGWVCTAA